MDKQKIEYWSYNMKDGFIQIWFDQQQRYISISKKDLKSMLKWVEMHEKELVK